METTMVIPSRYGLVSKRATYKRVFFHLKLQMQVNKLHLAAASLLENSSCKIVNL